MKTAKISLATCLVGLLGVATETTASADYSVAVFSGKAAWAADQGCFQADYGGAGNYWCPNDLSKTYVVYLPLSSQFAQGIDVVVSVYQESRITPIKCAAVVVDILHNPVHVTNWVYTNAEKSETALYLEID